MFNVPYETLKGFRPILDWMPDNEKSENPVEFDLAPAWGGDLARVRAIIQGSIGLVATADWSPENQDSVIGSLERGRDAFISTVTAIRGLTVPAAMAIRAGILLDPPKIPGTNQVDHAAKIPISTGAQFSRICGALPATSLHIATKIAELSGKAEAPDPRFFLQPSGSGGTAMPAAQITTAIPARRPSRRRATAGNGGAAAGRRPKAAS